MSPGTWYLWCAAAYVAEEDSSCPSSKDGGNALRPVAVESQLVGIYVCRM